MRFTFFILTISLITINGNSARKKNTQDNNIDILSHQNFRFHHLRSFTGDLILKVEQNINDTVDRKLFAKIFPDSFYEGQELDHIYFCSRQYKNPKYKSFTIVRSQEFLDDLVLVSYNLEKKPVGSLQLAAIGGTDGLGIEITSKLLNDSTIVRTDVRNDNSEEANGSGGEKYFTFYQDSTIEKFLIKSGGTIFKIDSRTFHKSEKFRNKWYNPHLDSLRK